MGDATISKKAEELIADFDAAAGTWCWEQDQGYSPTAVKNAEIEYERAGKALRDYITGLENG